jgi:hypothetical protein
MDWLGRIVVCVSAVCILALKPVSAVEETAPIEKAPASPTLGAEQEAVAAGRTEEPAVVPEELIEFCLKNREEDGRDVAISALQSLFEGLMGKHVARRSAENLLLNGGFEEWDAGLRCWDCYIGENARVTGDPTAARGGQWCLRIDLLEGAEWASVEQSAVVALSCAGFRLSGWTRRDGPLSFEIRVYSEEPDGDREELFKADFEPSDKEASTVGAWTHEEVEFPQPILDRVKDVQLFERVRVSFLARGRGSLWLDDFSLTAISEREVLELRERKLLAWGDEDSGSLVGLADPDRYWFPRGRVLDAASEDPVEGARVWGGQVIAFEVEGGRTLMDGSASATTDSSGVFAFHEPVMVRKLEVNAEGYQETDVIFEDGTEGDLTVLMELDESKRAEIMESKRSERGDCSIYGYITIDNSLYMGAVDVDLRRKAADNEDSFRLKVAKGEYRIEELPAGSYRMRMKTVDGYMAETTFALRADESKRVDFALDAEWDRPRKLWLAGYVRDARTGHPINGATVAMDTPRVVTRTNSRGFFMFMQQFEAGIGGWFVAAYKPGYEAGAVSVDPGTTVAEEGRVVVKVELSPGEETFSSEWEEVIVDEQ